MNLIEAIKNPGEYRLIRCKLMDKNFGWIKVSKKDFNCLFRENHPVPYVPRQAEILSNEWEVKE